VPISISAKVWMDTRIRYVVPAVGTGQLVFTGVFDLIYQPELQYDNHSLNYNQKPLNN